MMPNDERLGEDHVVGDGDTGGRPDGPARPDQLVVARGHLGFLRGELDAAGVAHRALADSDALGLALIELADPAAAADRLDPDGQGPALGRVLGGLRRRIAAEHAGWVPVVGKNRLVGQVARRGGEVSHGGGPEPMAVADVLPPRAAGPGVGVRVGVVDTGLVPHPWLAGGWRARWSDVVRRHPDDPAAPDVVGHAAFVAGLILAQAPGATVEVRGTLADDDGTATGWDLALAIVELGTSGVDILNLSVQCFTADSRPPLVLAAAIDRLPPDVVVVAAAGNHGAAADADDARRPSWPAALDDVIAVGAAERDGRPAAFSPRGCRWVDVLAPGTEVLSTFVDGEVALAGGPARFHGMARWGGTSFAAALVSGAIAAGTAPGRVSARASAADVLGTARPGPEDDGVPWLPVPAW
jgi:hypothetical protein